MSIGQLVTVAFGLLIIVAVVWNLRPTRVHGEGEDTWTASTGGMDGLSGPNSD